MKHDVNNNRSKTDTPVLMMRIPLSFPGSFPAGMPGCNYAHYYLPKYVKRVADSIWDKVIAVQQHQDDEDAESKHNIYSTNLMVTGHFHLCQGDGSRFCNTTLSKLHSYVVHSFVDTNSLNITLILATDEHNGTYLDELHHLMPPQVHMLELEAMIWQHTDRLIQLREEEGGLPSRQFLNNFFVFAVGQSLSRGGLTFGWFKGEVFIAQILNQYGSNYYQIIMLQTRIAMDFLSPHKNFMNGIRNHDF
jgi:hypothetical protein